MSHISNGVQTGFDGFLETIVVVSAQKLGAQPCKNQMQCNSADVGDSGIANYMVIWGGDVYWGEPTEDNPYTMNFFFIKLIIFGSGRNSELGRRQLFKHLIDNMKLQNVARLAKRLSLMQHNVIDNNKQIFENVCGSLWIERKWPLELYIHKEVVKSIAKSPDMLITAVHFLILELFGFIIQHKAIIAFPGSYTIEHIGVHVAHLFNRFVDPPVYSMMTFVCMMCASVPVVSQNARVRLRRVFPEGYVSTRPYLISKHTTVSLLKYHVDLVEAVGMVTASHFDKFKGILDNVGWSFFPTTLSTSDNVKIEESDDIRAGFTKDMGPQIARHTNILLFSVLKEMSSSDATNQRNVALYVNKFRINRAQFAMRRHSDTKLENFIWDPGRCVNFPTSLRTRLL